MADTGNTQPPGVDAKDNARVLTREELYQQVWATPVRHLARTYGLSDVGLAKLCKRHGIPTPPVGYWAKLAHGKSVIRSALPAAMNPTDPPIVIEASLVAQHRLPTPTFAVTVPPTLG